MVRLVVLSACDSGNLGALGNQLGSIAQTLHRCGFQSVIASRFPLSVAGSIALTESFYGTLLHGPHMTAFVAELGARRHGEHWLYRGRLRTKWVGPVCPGDAFVGELADDGTLAARVGEQTALVGSATLRTDG